MYILDVLVSIINLYYLIVLYTIITFCRIYINQYKTYLKLL